MKRPFWIPWLLLSIALSGSAYSVSDPVSDEPQQSLPGESGKNDADDNRGVGRLRHALRGLSDLVQAHGLADADLPARERRSAGHKRIALLAGSGSSGVGISERDAASLGARSRV